MSEDELNILPSHVQVFEFVDSFIQENKFAPTRKEIAEGTGMSIRHVERIIRELFEAGYFENKGDRKARNIKIARQLG